MGSSDSIRIFTIYSPILGWCRTTHVCDFTVNCKSCGKNLPAPIQRRQEDNLVKRFQLSIPRKGASGLVAARYTPGKKLIEWADANKMKRALEVLAKTRRGRSGCRRHRHSPGPTPGALRWSPYAEVEIHSVLYARGFETRSEGVVEIEPEKASKFNRPQQTSTDIHKVL